MKSFRKSKRRKGLGNPSNGDVFGGFGGGPEKIFRKLFSLPREAPAGKIERAK